MDRFAKILAIMRGKRAGGATLFCASLLVLAMFAWKQQAAFHRFREEPPAQQASAGQPLLIRGNPQLKQVALTFDDGPHPYATLKLLSVLQAYDVKATFFVVGEKAKLHPDLIRMEIDAGHEVGNHTMHHANLLKLPPDQAPEEISACSQVIRDITGSAPRYFRPPGGQYNRDILNTAAEQGFTTILWTDVARDYQMPGDTPIRKRILAHLNNGGIILLHDGIYQTADVLPKLITSIRQQGYEIVPLSELIATAKAADTMGGKGHGTPSVKPLKSDPPPARGESRSRYRRAAGQSTEVRHPGSVQRHASGVHQAEGRGDHLR